jgi:hypothetical protein
VKNNEWKRAILLGLTFGMFLTSIYLHIAYYNVGKNSVKPASPTVQESPHGASSSTINNPEVLIEYLKEKEKC